MPSTSAKDHLPYFEHVEFVRDLMAYSKLSKLRSTYVGAPGGVEYNPVKRLASGNYTGPVMEGFAAAGYPLSTCKAVRSRVRCFDFHNEDRKEITIKMQSGKKEVERTFGVDYCGNLYRKVVIEPSGFWNYITEDSGWIIHTSFVLHGTNTGRSASR